MRSDEHIGVIRGLLGISESLGEARGRGRGRAGVRLPRSAGVASYCGAGPAIASCCAGLRRGSGRGRLLQRATAVIARCHETAVASRQGAEAVRTGGAPGTPWLVALTKVSLRVPPSPSESLRAILSPSESLRVAPSLFDSLRVAPSRSESGVRGFAPALVRVAACGVCVCVCVG